MNTEKSTSITSTDTTTTTTTTTPTPNLQLHETLRLTKHTIKSPPYTAFLRSIPFSKRNADPSTLSKQMCISTHPLRCKDWNFINLVHTLLKINNNENNKIKKKKNSVLWINMNWVFLGSGEKRLLS